MESDVETGDRRNDVLSQSYTQGVGRIAQQNNDVGFSFELPKKVLEKREKVWDNLFDKYADEVSDEIELNIDTMEPVATEEDEDEEEEDDEDEPGEYYSKCRAPMRKLPSLIQYWVDTGNPPYQLVGEDDHSETGSSLSEGEHSRTGHSEILRESSDKQRLEDTSPYSSVDTTAYILSNTNITKKAETVAIVEGAKKPDDSQNAKISPRKDNIVAEKIAKFRNKNISFSSTERDLRTISNFTQNPSVSSSASKIFSESEPRILTTPLKNPKLDNLFSPSIPLQNHSSPTQQSVKLSEVLPTFQQFDELLDESQVMRPPRVRSSLSKVRRKPKLVVTSPTEEELTASQSSQTSSVLPNGLKKPHNRRKLYTGRNSPVDLVIERTSIDSVQLTGNCLHPALEPEIAEKPKVSTFASRARARRKRKRASQASERVSQEDNTSQDSGTPIGTEKAKGDMRYIDFFESLGLTPSKTIIGETPRKPAPKCPKKSEKRGNGQKPNEKVKLCDTIDSSIKETGDTSQLTEDSVFSSIGRKFASIEAENKHLENKILTVKINRLSEDCLARYQRRDVPVERLKNLNTAAEEHDRDIIGIGASSSSSSNKKVKGSSNENIELLTTITHDSDSSTILICACNNDNNGQYSDSDNSLFTKNKSKIKKKSSVVEKGTSARLLRSGEHKIPVKENAEMTRNFAKLAEFSQKPEIIGKTENSLNKTQNEGLVEKLSKLPQPFISLEKLPINNLPKLTKMTVSSRSREESERSIVQKNHQFTSEFSCSTKSPIKTGSSIDFFELSSSGSSSEEAKNKCVTIGSRVFNDLSKNPTKSQKLRITPVRCDLGISIPSDEEEDSFVKLVTEIRSERQKIEIETADMKKIGEELVNDMTNGDEGVTTVTSGMSKRFRSNFRISVSSDEEDEVSTRNVKKVLSKRRITKVESNKDTGKEVSSRKKKIVNHNHSNEVTNGEEEISLYDRLDELNRRKVPIVEKTHKNVEAEAKGKKDVKISARKKKLPSCEDIDEHSKNSPSSSTKPKHMRNLFQDGKESNVEDEDQVLPLWDKRKSELKEDKSGAMDVSQSDKSKNQITPLAKTTRSGRNDKSLTVNRPNLARFQTRLDSDSDMDVESLRFSLDTKYNKSINKAQTDSTEMAKKNCTEVSKKNESIVEDKKSLRTSTRRSFQKLIERRRELSEKKLKRENNLFRDSPDDSETDFIPTNIEATQETKSSNNRLPLRSEFTISDTSNKSKDSARKQKKIKLKIDSQEKWTPRKNSSKSERLKNSPKVSPLKQASSLLADQPKSESSPILKTKTRRTRILGTPMIYESDDDDILIQDEVDSTESLQHKKYIFPNGKSSKRVSDKYESDGQNSLKKCRDTTKNLFSSSPDDSIDDMDLIFGGDAKTRAKKCTVVIDSLNFLSANKHKNLNNTRQSTISFRTKLRSDSDDDNVL